MDISVKQEQFLELYEQSRVGLVRFARSMARNPEDAKDLVQETTLAAFERFETLKSPQAFKSFLFTIASRIHKRQNWRKRFFFSFANEEKEFEVFDNLVAPSENPDIRYDLDALQKALNKLSDKQREAVVLHEIVGMKMEEIADIQGGSVSGVKSRVQRGRAELERLLIGSDNKRIEKLEDYDLQLTKVKNSSLKISKIVLLLIAFLIEA